MEFVQVYGAIVPYDLSENKPFTIRENFIRLSTFYPTEESYTFNFSYILFDSKGAFKEKISPDFKRILFPANGNYVNIGPVECLINSKLADGDRITLCLQDSATGEWKAVSDDVLDAIVFNKRPLGSMVKIGYDVENNFRNSAVNGESLYMYFETLKDIPWVVYKEGSDKPVIWRCVDDYYAKHGAVESDIAIDSNDDSWCISHIWLPKGNYLAVFTNPLTGEEMKVHLEL